MPQSRRRSLRGVAILELALLSPGFVLLIIGALDWGAIAYALISLEGAARTAALYTSSSINTAAASADACALMQLCTHRAASTPPPHPPTRVLWRLARCGSCPTLERRR